MAQSRAENRAIWRPEVAIAVVRCPYTQSLAPQLGQLQVDDTRVYASANVDSDGNLRKWLDSFHRPVSFSPKRIAADRDAVLGTALRGRGAWHSSDRFSGTVRARESAQTAPGSGVRCRWVARGGVGPCCSVPSCHRLEAPALLLEQPLRPLHDLPQSLSGPRVLRSPVPLGPVRLDGPRAHRPATGSIMGSSMRSQPSSASESRYPSDGLFAGGDAGVFSRTRR